MTPAEPDIPDHFQVVHLDLAPEHELAEGSANDRYTLLLPLGPDGRILETGGAPASDHRRASLRTNRPQPGESSAAWKCPRPGPDQHWRFDFGETEEAGFRFGEERFAPGQYVVVLRGQDHHTYKVVALQPL